MRGLVGAAGNDAETVNDPGSCNLAEAPDADHPTDRAGVVSAKAARASIPVNTKQC